VNFFDYVLITIVGLSMVLSLWRGFVREIISLVGLVLAIFIAGRFSGNAGDFFGQWITQSSLANIAGFILMFVLVMFIVGAIGFIVRKLVDMAALTATDRTLGLFFGAARGMLLIGTAFLVYTAYAKPDQQWMTKSVISPYAIQLSELIGKTIPDGYPFSTQGEGKSAAPTMTTQQAIDTVQKHISPEDQEAMKSLLMETLKDANP
jgi:membrane protein required for colicin V production